MSARSTSMYQLALAMCCAAILGWLLHPTHYVKPLAAPLNDLVPRSFGGWRAIETGPAVVNPVQEGADGGLNASNPYDDVLMRTYSNADGHVVQLALAYVRRQSQEVKVHRPELCYTAQGFRVRSVSLAPFSGITFTSRTINGVRMLAEGPGRVEAVSYWMRIGGLYSDGAWAIRYQILKDGLAGQVDDGILVRASQVISGSSADLPASYTLQNQFLTALVASLPEEARRVLVR